MCISLTHAFRFHNVKTRITFTGKTNVFFLNCKTFPRISRQVGNFSGCAIITLVLEVDFFHFIRFAVY